MITRRTMISGVATLSGAALAGAPALAGAAGAHTPTLNEDGLYTQPWFLQTFLDMAEDHGDATSAGKRFAVIWEQKGCPYCKEMHTVNFARADINDYVRENFSVVQLNLWGAREVTDFDGEALEERALARRWRVNFTPTIQFFPGELTASAGKSGVDLEVARMPGYFKPFHFMSMFEYVRSNAYADQNFQRFLQDKFEDMRKRGIDPEVW